MSLENDYPRPVWISYSGKDQKVVNDLIKYSESPEFIKLQNTPNVEIKAFQREISSSKPSRKADVTESNEYIKYHLLPGDKISDLVDAIAFCPRRVFVISKNYLFSDYCLAELCCSLLRRGEQYPLAIILYGLPAEKVFTHKYSKTVNGRGQKTNLLHELVRVYKQKVNKEMSVVFRRDSGFNPLEYFKGKLVELQSQIYLEIKPQQSISKTCCESVMEYCKEQHSIIDRRAKDNFSKFWAKAIKKWADDKFVEDWLNEADIELETIQQSPTITQLNTDTFTQLKNTVLKWNRDKRKFSESEQNKIQEIAGILAVSLIDPIWAADMRVSSIDGARLRITFNNNLPMLADNEYLSCHLVTYATLRKPPRLIKQGKSVVVKDVLELVPVPQAREQKDKEIDALLSEILSRVLPESAREIRATLHEKKFDWPNKFIGRINSNYESMLNDDRFLSRASLFIGDNGKSIANQHLHWDDIVTELLDYLNKGADSEDKIKLSITIAGERNDGNLVQLITNKSSKIHSLMFIITDLLELCDE